MMVSAAEEIRQRNIDRNRLFLEGLGLGSLSHNGDIQMNSQTESNTQRKLNDTNDNDPKLLRLADTNILSVFKFRENEIKLLYSIFNSVRFGAN